MRRMWADMEGADVMVIRQKKDGRFKVLKDGKVVDIFGTEEEARACVEKWDIPAPEPSRRYRRRKVDE